MYTIFSVASNNFESWCNFHACIYLPFMKFIRNIIPKRKLGLDIFNTSFQKHKRTKGVYTEVCVR